MTISSEEAIQKAIVLLTSRLDDRLHVVDDVDGVIYNAGKLNLKNSWIIHVKPEVEGLDGRNKYILVDKDTGIITEIVT